MRRLSLIIAICVGVLSGGPVAAGDEDEALWDRAIAAYERGNFATAIAGFRFLAENGNAGAQYNLALIYSTGQGVPQDYVEAVKWYRKAAEQGDAEAQYNLALRYDNGQGVPQDHIEAGKWYRKAAEQGVAEAQNNLGFKFNQGQGVPKDDVRAYMWYSLAAAQGNETARVNRDSVAKMMTPAQIVEAHKLAREWRPKKIK